MALAGTWVTTLRPPLPDPDTELLLQQQALLIHLPERLGKQREIPALGCSDADLDVVGSEVRSL